MTKEDPPWLGPTQKKLFQITPSRNAKNASPRTISDRRWGKKEKVTFDIEGTSFSSCFFLIFATENCNTDMFRFFKMCVFSSGASDFS